MAYALGAWLVATSGGCGDDDGSAIDAGPRSDAARDGAAVDGSVPGDGQAPPPTPPTPPTPPGPPPPPAPDGGLPAAGGTVVPIPDASACGALVAGDDGSLAWFDARCRARATRLEGSVARFFDYVAGDEARHCSRGPEYDGFGYVVSHYRDTAFVEDGSSGSTRWLLRGGDHAIWEADWTIPASWLGAGDGTMRIVVHWLAATGRDHPVYAITYDLSGMAPNAYHGDSRSPYGELGFDGDRDGTIGGVGWGDRHRFTTLDEPLTKLNGWDYSAPNVVPYAFEWIADNDAEMGLVQTQTQQRHAAGGYWFYGAWGTTDPDGPMPEDWNWPYQLNQYSFAAGSETSSTRLAWGMNYGAVGGSAYAVLGDDPDNPPAGSPSGHPHQSYATFVVLGRHSDRAVLEHVDAVERMHGVAITAHAGSVVASGPGGVGRTDDVAWDPAGWDARYGVWRVHAVDGGLDVTFDTGSGEVVSPTVVVEGLGGAPALVGVEGVSLGLGSDVRVDVDPAGDAWLTFLARWRGAIRLVVR